MVLKNRISTQKPKFYEILLFLLIFSGPPRFRSRDPLSSFRGEIDWVVILNLIIWALGAIWVLKNFYIYIYKYKTLKFQSTEKLCLLFAFSLSLGIFVSQAPLLTSFRVFQIFIMSLFAYFWVRKFNLFTIRHLIIGYIVIGVVIILASILKPELVYVPYTNKLRLRGDYIANAGAIGLIGLILTLVNPPTKSKLVNLLLIIMFFYILLSSLTRTAYVGLILFFFLLLFNGDKKIYTLRWIRNILIVCLPVIFIYHREIFEFLIREENSISTLSDRTNVWSYIIYKVWEISPFIGLGFAAERLFTFEVNTGVGTAHSSFIAVFFGGGVIGSFWYIFLLYNMLTYVLRLFKYIKNPIAFSLISIFSSIILIGVTSEEIVMATPSGFTFYMLVSLLPSACNYIQNENYSYS